MIFFFFFIFKESWNCRFIGWFGLEETFKDDLIHPLSVGRDVFHEIRLFKFLSNLCLNTSNDGASTTFLGSLFWCFTTVTVKKFFLKSKLNLLSLSLKPLSFVLSLQVLGKNLSPSFLEAPFQYWNATKRSCWSLIFYGLNNPNAISFSM